MRSKPSSIVTEMRALEKLLEAKNQRSLAARRKGMKTKARLFRRRAEQNGYNPVKHGAIELFCLAVWGSLPINRFEEKDGLVRVIYAKQERIVGVYRAKDGIACAALVEDQNGDVVFNIGIKTHKKWSNLVRGFHHVEGVYPWLTSFIPLEAKDAAPAEEAK